MKFSEALTLAKNRVDETDTDTQIDAILAAAMQKAWMRIKTKVLPDTATATLVPTTNYTALPADFYSLYNPKAAFMGYDYRITGKTLWFELIPTEIRIEYIKAPALLTEGLVEIDLPYPLVYAMTSYAAYTYFLHRKKESLAQGYLSEFEGELMNYLDNYEDEIVTDDYEV